MDLEFGIKKQRYDDEIALFNEAGEYLDWVWRADLAQPD